MKNKINVPLVHLFGIIALVAVIGFSMAACGDGGGGGGGKDDLRTVTYNGRTSNITYSLKIIENKNNRAVLDDPKPGDNFEFTQTDSTNSKKSKGVVMSASDNEFTMWPTAATPGITFTTTVSDAGLIAMSGTITWTDGTTETFASEITLTPSGGSGTGSGGLTFSDGLPSEIFGIYIVPNSTATDVVSISFATQSFTACGISTSVSGNSVRLWTTITATVKWTGSGKYMVVVYYAEDGFFKYVKNVSFSGGNATIAKSSLITVNMGSGGGGGGIPGTYGDFEYTDYGDIWIDKYTGAGGNVTIPSAINGIPVTGIDEKAFYECTTLTGVTIPNNVTHIGNDAFFGCESLASVTFTPTSKVTDIGDSAFGHCYNLTSITIPASVTTIWGNAFFYCTSLTSITIPASVTSIMVYTFWGCTSLTSVTFAAGSNIADADFSDSAFDSSDLKTKYATGKAGTYTRASGGSTWTKQ